MTTTLFRTTAASACLLIVASGCLSPEARRIKRIEANQEVFSSATAAQQSLIKKGDIDIGFTPEMVLLSWGRPDYAFDRVTTEKRSRVWKYTSHRSRPSWEHATVPVSYRDSKGRYRTTYRTVTVDKTYYEEYAVAIVEFVDDKVSSFDVQATQPPDL